MPVINTALRISAFLALVYPSNLIKGHNMSQIARDAIRAAKHYKQWGRAATMRYCQKLQDSKKRKTWFPTQLDIVVPLVLALTLGIAGLRRGILNQKEN